MSQIEEAVRMHEEHCSGTINQRLVSWKWLVSIITGGVVTVITIVWCLASSTAEAKQNIRQHEKRITKIESIYEDIKWIRKKLEKK